MYSTKSCWISSLQGMETWRFQQHKTKDLTATNATGITFTTVVDNVTLDLMGFSLIGSGSFINSGVYMDARTNVEIRNGTIRNFGQHGIRENSIDGKDPG